MLLIDLPQFASHMPSLSLFSCFSALWLSQADKRLIFCNLSTYANSIVMMNNVIWLCNFTLKDDTSLAGSINWASS